MQSPLIKSVEILPINLPLRESFSIATGKQDEVKNVLIKIALENNITGLGEAAPFAAVSGETQHSTIVALNKISDLLIKKDIRSWKSICKNIGAALADEPAARCGLEMAVIDTFCRYYNLPVASLFGGAKDSLITDMTIVLSDLDETARAAFNIKNRHINTIKIKTAGQDPQFDAKRLLKVKEVFPDSKIIVDGNCGYTLNSAKEFLRILKSESVDLLFFEQPFPRDQWDDMKLLTKTSEVKIAADESCRSLEDTKKIINENAADIINIKLMKCGVIEAMSIVELAQNSGKQLMIGGMVETILSMSFSAHFAAGIGAFEFADLDTPLFIDDHIFEGGFKLSGEKITIDYNQPGHSVRIK